MSLSRKHFQDLANILAQSRPSETRVSDPEYFLWNQLRRDLAVFCTRHNSRFDRQRFFAATEK